MNEIAIYKVAYANLKAFKAWRSLIGKQYIGGAGGTGSVCTAACSLTVYWQEYDGSKNYHEPPAASQQVFNQAAKECSQILLDRVESLLESKLEEARSKAASLAREILGAA